MSTLDQADELDHEGGVAETELPGVEGQGSGVAATLAGTPGVPRKRPDWGLVESLYVFGEERGGELFWPTFLELAHRFGVTKRYVVKRAARDGWTAKRESHRDIAMAELARRKLARLVKRAEQVDEQALVSAERILALTAKASGALPPSEMAALALAGQRAYQLARSALGLALPDEEARRAARGAEVEGPDPLRELAKRLVALDGPAFEQAVGALAAVARAHRLELPAPVQNPEEDLRR